MKTVSKGKGARAFGKEIRAKRRSMELTQLEVADWVGISRYSVILMEQGKFIPRGDKFFRLGKVLGMRLDHFKL